MFDAQLSLDIDQDHWVGEWLGDPDPPWKRQQQAARMAAYQDFCRRRRDAWHRDPRLRPC